MTEPAIDRLLTEARSLIEPRITVADFDSVGTRDGLVVDIRPVEQRQRDGELLGALVIDRNVLEWRLDPTSPHRIPEVVGDLEIVVVCNEGYASTLAAATLRRLGLTRVTDLVGGFQALLNRPTAPG